MQSLWQLPATRLVSLIRQRKVSSFEVTQAFVERIQNVNPMINALVNPCFEQALQQARNWDAAPDSTKSLGGVPFSIKELIQIAGMPCTIGSLYRKNVVATQTATVVKRLLEAGGILLGTTNLPERSFWMESSNLIYGCTNNPYDLKRTPGGSSGGEAALIAAGGSPLGIGSDIGGSVRLPAFFCGVFAHKPSAGLIPISGHYPFELPQKQPWSRVGPPECLTIGPLAHSVQDLKLALSILSGPDGQDPTCQKTIHLDQADVNWSDCTVFIMPRPRLHYCTRVSPEVSQSVHQAAKVFANLGAQIEELPDTLFYDAMDMWNCILLQDGANMRDILGDGNKPIGLVGESLQLIKGSSQHTPAALLFAWINQVHQPGSKRQRQLFQEIQRLQNTLQRKLKPNNILIMPPQPTVAPMHGELLNRPFDFGYTAIINVLQLPATSVPLGLNSQGLPLGVQIVGPINQDQICLQAARVLEQQFGGWKVPWNLKPFKV